MVKYICAQPAITYYVWQVEVMINNFIKHKVNPSDIHILLGIQNDIIPEDWKILQNHYKEVGFYFYNDTRTDLSYIPSLYFHLLSKHLTQYPHLQESTLFTHDSDIILTRPIEFGEMLSTKKWYISDTNAYINYDYIQQKGNDVYLGMCKIIGIDPLIPKLLNSHSGGAQYIVKNTTVEFWDKVERDSVTLYKWFCEIEPQYQKKHVNDYPIQKWTAGMWSYLWNGWLFGNETLVDKRLDFGWCTDGNAVIELRSILHNAGVTSANEGMFYKGGYINHLPYGDVLELNEKRASSYYWNEVCETAKISPFPKNRKSNVIIL
jgi:hypothetical protein